MDNVIDILGTPINIITVNEALDAIVDSAKSKKKCLVATVNSEFIVEAQNNSNFGQILRKARLSLPDGIGIIWAAQYQSTSLHASAPFLRWVEAWSKAVYIVLTILVGNKQENLVIKERVTGVDLVYQLAKVSAKESLTLFLLGGPDGVARELKTHLENQFPGIKISGAFAGNGGVEGDGEARALLSKHSADILLVAYGAPKQELWLERNLPHVPATVGIGVGGTFSYLLGEKARAPMFMQQHGLEWLFRLIYEPWRWRRQLALPRFMALVVSSQIKRGLE
jgi:N-acetylglucosaminyldiphosphoundecaprenol N-acetyl-beta-D-mannosaminyltransferase